MYPYSAIVFTAWDYSDDGWMDTQAGHRLELLIPLALVVAFLVGGAGALATKGRRRVWRVGWRTCVMVQADGSAAPWTAAKRLLQLLCKFLWVVQSLVHLIVLFARSMGVWFVLLNLKVFLLGRSSKLYFKNLWEFQLVEIVRNLALRIVKYRNNFNHKIITDVGSVVVDA